MKAIFALFLASSLGLFAHAAPINHEQLKPMDTIDQDVDFGEVYVGDFYDVGAYFRFDQDTTFTEITKTGDDFSIAHNCPDMLPAGKRCFMYFIFEPTQDGDSTGEVVVKTTTDEYHFHLKGTGVAADGGGDGGDNGQN